MGEVCFRWSLRVRPHSFPNTKILGSQSTIEKSDSRVGLCVGDGSACRLYGVALLSELSEREKEK